MLSANWTVGHSSQWDVTNLKYPHSLSDAGLSLRAAVPPFVISGDLDHILDYVQIKSHYENLNPQNGDDGQCEPQPEHMATQSKPLSMNIQYNLEKKQQP